MGMEESALTRGQLTKLNEPPELVGDELGGEVFETWTARQSADSTPGDDPVAMRISQALAGGA